MMEPPQGDNYADDNYGSDNYGADFQGPVLPDYDEDLDESFVGPGGPLYAGDELDYEEHWDNYEEEELYDQGEPDELLSSGDREGNSPVGASTPQPLVTGVGDSIQGPLKNSFGFLRNHQNSAELIRTH